RFHRHAGGKCGSHHRRTADRGGTPRRPSARPAPWRRRHYPKERTDATERCNERFLAHGGDLGPHSRKGDAAIGGRPLRCGARAAWSGTRWVSGTGLPTRSLLDLADGLEFPQLLPSGALIGHRFSKGGRSYNSGLPLGKEQIHIGKAKCTNYKCTVTN